MVSKIVQLCSLMKVVIVIRVTAKHLLDSTDLYLMIDLISNLNCGFSCTPYHTAECNSVSTQYQYCILPRSHCTEQYVTLNSLNCPTSIKRYFKVGACCTYEALVSCIIIDRVGKYVSMDGMQCEPIHHVKLGST